MSITIRDAVMEDELRQMLGAEIAVYAADGTLLGRFTPAPRPGVTYPEFGLTDEELGRRENDPNAKWYTPDEVMARLRAIDEAG